MTSASASAVLRRGRRVLALLLLPLLAATARAEAPPPAEPPPIAHGLFSDVRVHPPAGTARQFVMLVTADVAPDPRERRMLRTMVEAGAMVAVVPLAPFYRKLVAQDGKCTYAAGAFENLSRHLQAFERLPTYLSPMLAGADDEAAFVYALLAQAPAGTFASALSPGFCPWLALQAPPCAVNALRWEDTSLGHAGGGPRLSLKPPAAALPGAWIALQDDAPPACAPAESRAFVQAAPHGEWSALPTGKPASATAAAAFDAAYRKLASTRITLVAPPTQLADLPIVEVPVAGNGDRFVVLLSGDGGWAGIDKSLGSAMAAQGVPVAGFDSLRYFWSARTPDQLAADLDRVIRYYAARWGRSEVILVGYSQGADVLPFAINRLPAATRASVRLTALLGPGQKASFEFHLSNWIGPSGDLPIAPEALKLPAAETLCLYGQEEKDSLCPQLAPEHAQAVPLAGGHHFDGEYAALAARILEAAPR